MFLLPMNGLEIVFHETVSSFSLSSPAALIKRACGKMTNLEEYPFIYSELERVIHDINKNFGSSKYLNDVVDDALKKANYTLDPVGREVENKLRNRNELTYKPTP